MPTPVNTQASPFSMTQLLEYAVDDNQIEKNVARKINLRDDDMKSRPPITESELALIEQAFPRALVVDRRRHSSTVRVRNDAQMFKNMTLIFPILAYFIACMIVVLPDSLRPTNIILRMLIPLQL